MPAEVTFRSDSMRRKAVLREVPDRPDTWEVSMTGHYPVRFGATSLVEAFAKAIEAVHGLRKDYQAAPRKRKAAAPAEEPANGHAELPAPAPLSLGKGRKKAAEETPIA